MKRFTAPFKGPLAGLRVIEIGSDVSVAFGARLLSDLGAEVIKIEPLGGDALRKAPPFAANGESAFFAYLNRGKQIAVLDASTTAGWRLQCELSAKADLVIAEATRLKSPVGAGVDDSDWPQRPVTIAVSPHGLSGPDTERHASPFVLQHASGFAFHQASPVTNPESTPPVGCADWEGGLATGLVAAIAALWAIEGAGSVRPGPIIDLSHEDALTYLLVEPFGDWQSGVDVSARQRDPSKGLTIAGGLVWYLPCADGNIMVSPREDHQWQRWCEVMGHPEWTNDADLCGDRVVRTNRAARLQEKMAVWSVTQRTRDVVAAAQEARVACFPVSMPEDLIKNAQLHDRRFFSETQFEDGEQILMAGLPFRFVTQQGDELPRGNPVSAPAPGNDAGSVLAVLEKQNLDNWAGRSPSDKSL
jgi:crotonobetainyl-CoA:carnitine CoA-transferase CaiB-like acyl-CoA transferase